MQSSKFDPVEYQTWSAEPALQAEFAAVLSQDSDRAGVVGHLKRADLLALYEGMVRFRLFDTMLKRWVKQGVITKAWLGTGEEAVSIGCAQALRSGDAIGPMIRNAGACFQMGMPMLDHFSGYLGTTQSLTNGRDLHVGDLSHGVVAPISHVGSLLPVMVGLALGYKLRSKPSVAMTWVGDGASRTGEVHEAVNFAAVQRLPIVIVLQNNRIALGTKNDSESVGRFEDWFTGYGMKVETVDGNNVLDVYGAAKLAVDACRAGDGPVALVANTFRMGGHSTHDEAEARRLFPSEDFEHWGKRDPIRQYGEWLVSSGRLHRGSGRRGQGKATRQALEKVENKVNEDVEAAADVAKAGKLSQQPDPSSVALGVYSESNG